MNNLMRLFFVCSLLITNFVNAQMSYSTDNKKAIVLFERALNSPNIHYDPNTGLIDYTEGINLLQDAIKRDPNFIEAHELIADYYKATGRQEQAITQLREAISLNPERDATGYSYFELANLLFENGHYEEAITYANAYLKFPSKNSSYVPKTNLIIQSCEFARYAMAHAYAFDPVNLGPGINTDNPEYFPTLTVDGKTMLFTRRLYAPALPMGAQEDFYISTLDENNKWGKAIAMPNNINTQNNEGAPTLAPDGRSLIFVACADESGDYGYGRNGRGSCDLFITKQIGSRWVNPKNLPGGVNTRNWESQPSLSADGKTVYFVRGTYNKEREQQQDIYRAYLQADGTWSTAERLSDMINTPYREESVLIHPDGKTLYFSSDGHPGMGGSDIFMSTMDDDGNWSIPINLGYPINTHFDENSIMVGADGAVAFFASDRQGGYGGLDLYGFDLPKQFRPTKTLYMDGTVFDIDDRHPLAGHFQLIDLKSGKLVIESDADPVTGDFLVSLPTNRDYALNVSYPGYSFYSKNFTLTNPENDLPYHMTVPMEALRVNNTVVLNNVFFDLAKYTLRPESEVELNKLVDFLNLNPKLKIEIGGYTDTRGDAVENQKLSENRAKSVCDYLISKSISADRVTYKGYGESNPKISDEAIAAMSTDKEKEAAHQQNRRTEFKITSN